MTEEAAILKAQPLSMLKPTAMGPTATAWELPAEGWPARVLQRWVVTLDKYHPKLKYMFVSLIHLRSLPEEEAPTVYLPGASHEISAYALTPECVPTLIDPFDVLSPHVYASQFFEVSDQKATIRFQQALNRMLVGKFDPLAYGDADWVNTFGWVKGLSGEEFPVPILTTQEFDERYTDGELVYVAPDPQETH